MPSCLDGLNATWTALNAGLVVFIALPTLLLCVLCAFRVRS